MSQHYIYLQKRNPEKRQHRFYSLLMQPNLFGSFSVIRNWGRIGSPGCERIDLHDSEDSATDFMQRKANEKRRRGYIHEHSAPRKM